MNKFTKERLEEIVELAKKATYKPCAMHMTNLLVVCDSEVIEEMARQLLAGMKQEPVAWQWLYRDKCHVTNDPARAKFVAEDGDVTVTPLYAAPQLPQPAVVDDDKFRADFERWMVDDEKCIVGSSDPYPAGIESRNWRAWNACRAAMLQGAEPVSQSDELPMDYLQGHKDGLEWAARLAEANHPQTGDWLYDDPLELAKAISKGPDMPTAPVQGWIPCSERMPEEIGRYWCYVEEQNSLGKSHYQWNCSWNGDGWWVESENGGRVTHWMPMPAAPQQEVKCGR